MLTDEDGEQESSTNNIEENEKQFSNKKNEPMATNFNVEEYPILYYLAKNGPYQIFICICIYLYNFYESWFMDVFSYSLGGLAQPRCIAPTTIKDACSKDCLEIKYDVMLLNVTAAVEFRANCQVDNYSKLVKSIRICCFFVVCFLGPYVIDRYGRRPFFIMGVVLHFICSIGIQFSMNLWMVLFFATIEKATTILSSIVTLVLLLEIVSSNMFEWNFSLYVLSSCLGRLAYAGLSYAYGNWRSLNIFSVIFCVLFAPFILFIPESPEWCFANGRLDETIKILHTLLRWNKKKNPIEVVRSDIEKAWRITRTRPKSNDSFFSIFYYGCMRRVLFLVCFISFTNGLVISVRSISVSKNYHVDRVSSTMGRIAGAVAYMCIQPFVGRKRILVFGLALTASLMLLNAIALEIDPDFNDVYLVFLYLIVIHCCVINSVLYWLELFPTNMRGISVGFIYFFTTFGSHVINFINQLLYEQASWLPSAIVSFVCFYGVSAAGDLPETKSYPLPHSLRDAEALALRQRQAQYRNY